MNRTQIGRRTLEVSGETTTGLLGKLSCPKCTACRGDPAMSPASMAPSNLGSLWGSAQNWLTNWCAGLTG
jgi:hypothetical protein